MIKRERETAKTSSVFIAQQHNIPETNYPFGQVREKTFFYDKIFFHIPSPFQHRR